MLTPEPCRHLCLCSHPRRVLPTMRGVRSIHRASGNRSRPSAARRSGRRSGAQFWKIEIVCQVVERGDRRRAAAHAFRARYQRRNSSDRPGSRRARENGCIPHRSNKSGTLAVAHRLPLPCRSVYDQSPKAPRLAYHRCRRTKPPPSIGPHHDAHTSLGTPQRRRDKPHAIPSAPG